MTASWPEHFDRHHSLITISIQGIPMVFVAGTPAISFQHPFDAAAVPTETLNCLDKKSLRVGRSRLNRDTRVEEGATIDFTLLDRGGVLRRLIQPRAEAATYLTTGYLRGATGNITPANTSIPMWRWDGGGGGAADLVFIGPETLSIGGTSGGDWTGIGRGRFGSPIQSYFGGLSTQYGTEVFSVPPVWRGRKVLVRVYDNSDRGQGDYVDIAIGRLTGPPTWSRGDKWRFNATTLSNWFRERLIYMGQREVKPVPGEANFFTGTSPASFQVPDDTYDLFQPSLGTMDTYILADIDRGDAKALYSIGGRTAPDKILPGAAPYGLLLPRWHEMPPRITAADALGINYKSIKHIGIVEGPAWFVALTVILSVVGDGTNDSLHDQLPGVEATVIDGQWWRMGAGVDSGDVDAESFRNYAEAPWLTYFITQQTTLGEFLKDFCKVTGTMWFVSGDGKLTLAPLRYRVPPSEAVGTFVVSDSSVLISADDQAVVDEDTIRPTVTWKANWDLLSEKFLAETSAIDIEQMRRYPDSGQRTIIESKLIGIESESAFPAGTQRFRRQGLTTAGELRIRIRREQAQAGKPRITIPSVPLSFRAAKVRPGQVVALTDPRIPDMAGGTYDSHPFLVTGRGVDLDSGRVNLDLERLEAGFLIMPALRVVSYDAIGEVITVCPPAWATATGYSVGDLVLQGGEWYYCQTAHTSGTFASDLSAKKWRIDTPTFCTDPTAPTDDIFEEWVQLILYDRSGDAREVLSMAAGVTATTIPLGSTPTIAPAKGDILSPVWSATPQPNCPTGFNPSDGIAMVGSDGLLGSDPGTRWS